MLNKPVRELHTNQNLQIMEIVFREESICLVQCYMIQLDTVTVFSFMTRFVRTVGPTPKT